MMVLSLLGLAVALGTLAALGYALLTRLAPDAPLWWFERAAFSFVLGIGGAAFVWAALTPIYGFVRPRWAVLLVTCAVVAAGKRGRESFSGRFTKKTPVPFSRLDPLLVVCSMVMMVQFVALMAAAMHSPLGWDGLFNQEFKARVAFEHRAQGQLPLAYFSDVSRAWSHPRYPLLVPWAEFWIYSWLGRVDQQMVKVLFPLYFFAVIAVMAGAIRRLANARTAFVSAVAFACALPVAVDLGTNGYADMPLAAAFTAALSCAILALNTRRSGMFVLAGAFAAIAAWTKTEGWLLSMYLGTAVFIAARGVSLRVRTAGLWMPLAVMVPWFAFQYFHGIPEADFPSLRPSVALANLHRLPEIVMLVLRALLTPGRWGLLWPAFAVACALMAWQRNADAASLLLSGAVVVPLAAYTLIYLFSSWTDVGEHVRTSVDRMLTSLASAALIFTVSRAWLSFT